MTIILFAGQDQKEHEPQPPGHHLREGSHAETGPQGAAGAQDSCHQEGQAAATTKEKDGTQCPELIQSHPILQIKYCYTPFTF